MRRLFLLVLVLGLLVTTIGVALAELPPGGRFTDDDGNIHEGNIEAIAADGITLGCNPPANDRYCPSSRVTRGQMAAFLVRALGLTDRLDDPFVDDDGSIFESDIERLAAAGITKGCNPPTNDRYCPDAFVTRGQMAAFLVRGFGYTDAGAGDLFGDDDGSVFEGDIDRLGTAGVTKGCNPPTNDRYCPDELVLRDQMASFLSRALDLPPIFPPPRANTFGDGIWIVGVDIAPGTYRNDGPQPGLCHAKRLSGLGGEPNDVIASKGGYEPFVVTIEATDAGFSSEDCALWTDDTTPRTSSPTAEFGMGHWVVGDEVAPGLWTSGGGEWCLWGRLSGFSWEADDLIEWGAPYQSLTVRIEPTDQGFFANEFCSFRYLGP